MEHRPALSSIALLFNSLGQPAKALGDFIKGITSGGDKLEGDQKWLMPAQLIGGAIASVVGWGAPPVAGVGAALFLDAAGRYVEIGRSLNGPAPSAPA